MATTDNRDTKVGTIQIANDNPYIQIRSIKLDGSASYLAWSRSALLFIKAHRLQGYINGEKSKPDIAAPTLDQWDF